MRIKYLSLNFLSQQQWEDPLGAHNEPDCLASASINGGPTRVTPGAGFKLPAQGPRHIALHYLNMAEMDGTARFRYSVELFFREVSLISGPLSFYATTKVLTALDHFPLIHLLILMSLASLKQDLFIVLTLLFALLLLVGGYPAVAETREECLTRCREESISCARDCSTMGGDFYDLSNCMQAYRSRYDSCRYKCDRQSSSADSRNSSAEP